MAKISKDAGEFKKGVSEGIGKEASSRFFNFLESQGTKILSAVSENMVNQIAGGKGPFDNAAWQSVLQNYKTSPNGAKNYPILLELCATISMDDRNKLSQTLIAVLILSPSDNNDKVEGNTPPKTKKGDAPKAMTDKSVMAELLLKININEKGYAEVNQIIDEIVSEFIRLKNDNQPSDAEFKLAVRQMLNVRRLLGDSIINNWWQNFLINQGNMEENADEFLKKYRERRQARRDKKQS